MKLVFFLKILIFNIRVKYHFRTFIENIISNKYLSMKTIHIRILIISFVILLAACTNKEKTNLQKERTDNFPSMNDASKANLSAGETYQTLLQSFRISRSQTDSIIYPSYYGGAYINSNNQLVIILSDTTKENKISIIKPIKKVTLFIVSIIYNYHNKNFKKPYKSPIFIQVFIPNN